MVLLGAVHAYFIWFGDILFMYAAVGMLAYLFRNRTPRTLIILAGLFLPVTLLLSHGIGWQMQKTISEVAEITALGDAGESLTADQEETLEDWADKRAFMAPTDEDVQTDVDVHRGS